jgi:predicted small metal-binding protein
MAKILRCRDIGFDCGKVVHGDTEEEVLAQAAQHAQNDHGVPEITDEIVRRVRAAIRSEPAATA